MKTRTSNRIRLLSILFLAADATLPVTFAQTQKLDIQTYAGLTITGEIGKVYSIEYRHRPDRPGGERLEVPGVFATARQSASVGRQVCPGDEETVLPCGADGTTHEHGVYPAGDVSNGEPGG